MVELLKGKNSSTNPWIPLDAWKPRLCSNCNWFTPKSGTRMQTCPCLEAIYCSRDCQKSHWKQEHNATCAARANKFDPYLSMFRMIVGLTDEIRWTLAVAELHEKANKYPHTPYFFRTLITLLYQIPPSFSSPTPSQVPRTSPKECLYNLFQSLCPMIINRWDVVYSLLMYIQIRRPLLRLQLDHDISTRQHIQMVYDSILRAVQWVDKQPWNRRRVEKTVFLIDALISLLNPPKASSLFLGTALELVKLLFGNENEFTPSPLLLLACMGHDPNIVTICSRLMIIYATQFPHTTLPMLHLVQLFPLLKPSIEGLFAAFLDGMTVNALHIVPMDKLDEQQVWYGFIPFSLAPKLPLFLPSHHDELWD